jgi:hypothetical protein
MEYRNKRYSWGEQVLIKNSFGCTVFTCALALLSSCTADEMSKYANSEVINTLLAQKNEVGVTHSLAGMSGVNSNSTICIIGPYQSEVDEKYIFSNKINKKLKEISYVGDEGYWALVQYIDKDIFQISVMQQTNIKLKNAIFESNDHSSGMCADVKNVIYSFNIDNQIEFFSKGN